MDVWAIGCTIYELYKGEILFPGRSNNEMLALMMDLKGSFPKKMLKKGTFTHKHFENDANMSFALQSQDQVTGQPVSCPGCSQSLSHWKRLGWSCRVRGRSCCNSTMCWRLAFLQVACSIYDGR